MDSSYPSVPKLTRRRLLSGASRVAAAAAASALMPPNVQRLLALGPPRSGSLKDIKHVVLLMQENRSFDHYFGTLAGVRGFDDPSALKLADGKSVFYQPDAVNPSGYVLPFHLDTRKSSAQKIPSTSHAWAVQHASWNGGKMDKWLEAHRKARKLAGQKLARVLRWSVSASKRLFLHRPTRMPSAGDWGGRSRSYWD